MAFYEIQFPTEIGVGAVGGPGFSTDIVEVNSGFEQRNANWSASRHVFDVSHGARTSAQMNELIAFFRLMKGRAHSFRFKDWTDYIVVAGEGVFLQLTPTTFQMQKKYVTGGYNDLRTISKPVSGTIALTGGAGSTIDYTTGILTVGAGSPTPIPTAWTGQFDVPCRFDTDQMKASIDDYEVYAWGQIPVVEIRV
jgi:uncharacterized protein (TIGR02217 family)